MLEVGINIIYVALATVLGGMTGQVYKARRFNVPPSITSRVGGEVDLPSVTVCIPARNEQHTLSQCLDNVISSTYQRLEVIVLDDVSGDDTSSLIKIYASEGVRFVQGKKLPEGWLGKNRALQGLLNEASGSYVLFMDVDTIISPSAIEHMVRYALAEGAAMVSVVPRREDGLRPSVVLSPLRYFWEIMFHRKGNPATSSNAWMVRREDLISKLDGFNNLKNTVQPEATIAREFSKTNEYRMLVSTKEFGVSYEKRWSSQVDTSLRLLHPLIGSNLLLSLLVVFDLLLLASPFIILPLSLATDIIPLYLIIASAALAVYSVALYSWYAHRVWRRGWLIGGLLWPVILIQEAILVIVSAVQYKTKTVRWKGRLIQPEVQS